jgi:hypothetical protein
MTVLIRWARDGVRPQPVQLGLSAVALFGALLVITRGRSAGLSSFGSATC